MQNTVGFIGFSLLKVQSAIVLILNLTYTSSEKRKLRRQDPLQLCDDLPCRTLFRFTGHAVRGVLDFPEALDQFQGSGTAGIIT
jgi:hypothetical protein